jgi:hypothetical protein
MRHVTLPATGVAACWGGPTRPTGTATCRLWCRRHLPAGDGSGGRCHVPPAQACRHSALVLFGNNFQRWSFLPIHSRRWSDSSKIQFSSPSSARASLCIVRMPFSC